jgi:two-component system response regulator PilR (NtrC family)
VKLLRVLQERRIRRVGATSEIEVDARVITATNQDLEALVASRRFREDLYYRINVIPIHLPPLRERREDIDQLASHFLENFRRIIGKKIESVAPESLEALRVYDWPGNIRELENVIERAVALESSSEITPESLPQEVRSRARRSLPREKTVPEEGFDVETHLESLRRQYMQEAMTRSGGVQSRAAALLGMSFRSFRYFAKKYGLGPHGGEPGGEGEAEEGELEREVETGQV